MILDFVAGCLGGCAGILVGYPLDTVKVHMQTQDYRNPKYRGTWHCLSNILAKESVTGLYRGMSSPMAGVAVVNAVVFGVYGQTQKHLAEPEHLLSHFLAGASAGIAQSPICAPIELAKTRLQLQTSAKNGTTTGQKFTGPVACLRHIYREHGSRGIFNGLTITLLREAPSYGMYFLTYEALTRTNDRQPISTIRMLLAGGIAGTVSWVVSYPLDVIKSRLQADVVNKYSGIVDCYRQSVRAEGYSCLYRGLNSTILRAFPTNAATFAVVTWTLRVLGQQPVDRQESNDSRENLQKNLYSRGGELQSEIWGEKAKAFLAVIPNGFATSSGNGEKRIFSRNYSTFSLIDVSASYLTTQSTNGEVRDNEERNENAGHCKFCREDVRLEWPDVEDAIVMCRCNLQRVMHAPDFSNI